MKLLILLVLLPIVYSQTRLKYDSSGASEITSYSFSWLNSGGSGTEMFGPDDSMISIIEDDILTEGAELINPDAVWTDGLDATFSANTFNPGQGNKYYKITSISITFTTDCDVDMAQTSVSAFRYATGSSTKTIIGDASVTSIDGSSIQATHGYTFTAPIANTGLPVDNSMGIGFDVNMIIAGGCEGYVYISEFSIIGQVVVTDPPTTSPTTKQPTLAPTRECIGQITWGDPHYELIAHSRGVPYLNYQGEGWYYYMFPCNIQRDYKDFPFYLLSKHNTCFIGANRVRKSCIGGNRIVINTKPLAWIIAFESTYHIGFDIVQVGTDVAGRTIADFDTTKKYTAQNPLVIKYDDGGVAPGNCGANTVNTACQQSGELRIYYDSGQIVLVFYDISYLNYPRTCNSGQSFGADCPGDYKCDGKVIEIRNRYSWTVFTCPSCLRNIACGLMGKYTRGDCTSSELNDETNECYDILQGSNGQLYQPPNNDNTFGEFADTWEVDQVNNVLQQYGLSEVSGLRIDGNLGIHKWAINAFKKRSGKILQKEARIAADLQVVDALFYDGACKNDMVKIREVNETCRQNTVVKYERCCKEIGICLILWKACIEDLCACAAPNPNNTWTESMCLDRIIHESMNTTCSWDALWPTATPTATPTKSPTGLVVGLARGKKIMDLIWLYLIFVMMFVLIAAAAYWYYKKKYKNKVDLAAEDEEQDDTTHIVYA